MATVTTVTKNVIKRDWLEIEPKLLAVAAGLASATALTEIATLFHYNLNPSVAVAVAGLLSLLVGYFKSSNLKSFPVAPVVAATADVIKAVDPAIADQVSTVQNLIQPAFDSPAGDPNAPVPPAA